jgi:hypothetical protein
MQRESLSIIQFKSIAELNRSYTGETSLEKIFTHRRRAIHAFFPPRDFTLCVIFFIFTKIFASKNLNFYSMIGVDKKS